MNKPPPLRVCRVCSYNIGNYETGLCATCDPNHRWWKKEDKRVDDCTKQLESMTMSSSNEKRIVISIT